MKLLLDTNILLKAAADTLTKSAQDYILEESNELYYSSASIWEVVIKRGLNRPDFEADPHLLHKALLSNGYITIPITAAHTLLTGTLPMIHKDPFDRILIAQSISEGISLLTTDERIAEYPAPVILVK
ncbi:MAG: type II toxin-antitoxin system VapC family toxin [Oscillospiraceae bacterium]|nr:type II toxin-antitoxin system VapC family toxin [Oscillospiraceae bacterium]MCL2278384.1 type II toxin-antitoxin system VapC family toxin [Oscillospiraceae bacterium]